MKASRIGYSALGLLVALIWIFPVYWMASTAFKPGKAMYSATPQLVPLHPTLANFRSVIDDDSFWRAAGNTLTATVLTLIATMGRTNPEIIRRVEGDQAYVSTGSKTPAYV